MLVWQRVRAAVLRAPGSGPGESGVGSHQDDGDPHDAFERRVAAVVDARLQARLGGRLETAVDDAVDEAVEERVDETVGDAVEEAVEDAVTDEVEELLDPASLKEAARATPEQPFGRPGRPMNRRSPFLIAFTGALGVALAYGLVQAMIAVRSVLVLLLVSAFLAIGLDPAVRGLESSGVRRNGAVAVVLAGVVLLFTGFGYAVVPPLVQQGTEFVEAVPEYVAELQRDERLEELEERYAVLERIETFLDQPERFGEQAVGGVIGVGQFVLNGLFSTVTVLILTLYFLSSLPAIKAAAYRLVPHSRRPRVAILTDEILARVGGYVAGALVIATIAGFSAFVVLLALEVPYPLALSLLVGVTALVPLIGAVIAGTAMTLVAFFVSAQTAVVVAVYFLVYQQVENYLLYPRIMKRSVDVSPAATVVAVLIGGSLLGVLGALLAIPTAAAVQLVLQQVVEPRQDRR